MNDILEILGLDQSTTCSQLTTGSLNEAVFEMKNIYQERSPYSTAVSLDGVCYIFNDAFIANCLKSMANDNLDNMTNEEKTVWYNYVIWCNTYSTSANELLEPTAIGCTIPDTNGDSFIVLEDGTITTTLCDDPTGNIDNPAIYEALDLIFVQILNCEEYNVCSRANEEVTEVVTCQ